MEAIKTCRTCMTTCEKLYNIYDATTASDNVSLSDVIESFGGFKLSLLSEMPQNVCPRCYRDINYLYEFAVRCKNTEKALVDIFCRSDDNVDNSIMICETSGDNIIVSCYEETESDCQATSLKIKHSETIDDAATKKRKNHKSESSNEDFDDEIDENAIPLQATSKKEVIRDGNLSDDYMESSKHYQRSKRPKKSNPKLGNPKVETIEKLQTFGDYDCSICGKKFNFESYYASHIKLHDMNREHVCHICKYRYASKKTLQTHLETHADIKPHKCKVCFKAFRVKLGLDRHMIWHGTRADYGCNICHKKFKTSTLLKRHMFVHVDPEDKPYICDFCGKVFSQAFHLKVHRRTHTGEKPYECSKCSKRFTVKAEFSKHEPLCAY